MDNPKAVMPKILLRESELEKLGKTASFKFMASDFEMTTGSGTEPKKVRSASREKPQISKFICLFIGLHDST